MEEEGKEEDNKVVFHRRDHVRVVFTDDEWESMIGVIEEFMYNDGTTSSKYLSGCEIIVYFPTDKDEMRSCKLTGVNIFTSFVKQHLRIFDGLKNFEPQFLEIVDISDL